MNIQTIIQNILAIAGTFNIWIVIALFFVCFINEAGLFVPYLMESIWILLGYSALSGAIPLYQLLVLWLTAVSGRLVGASLLYYLLGLGSAWILKVYRKLFGSFWLKLNLKMIPCQSE